MKYGLPYQGSKSKIAEWIINHLPEADNLYDLFAGGGAITHCALLNRKWKNIIANDIQGTMSLFQEAINGKFKNEKRWISREQFHTEKGKDYYIRWIWSFGNDGDSYIFGKEIEDIKREAHEYLFSHGYDYTSQKRVELIKEFKEQALLNGRFELQQLEQLERIQQLERLERIQQLEISSTDYREVNIKPNSVIYCDIPYNQKEGKKGNYYGIEFSKLEFYDWVKKQKIPVYFSSSFCEDNTFIEIATKHKESLMKNKNSHNNKKIIEKLYWNGIGEKAQHNLFQ